MAEYFDICDENTGLPTGQTAERAVVHREGLCHRTAHVWLTRTVGGRPEILLQKRAADKDSFPGCLDTSSAGHIPAGQEPKDSALRELAEELGITAAADELRYIGTFRIRYEQPFHGVMFRDNEFANVFVYERPADIADMTIQREELESVGWYDFAETLRAVRERDPLYCVPLGGLELLGREMGWTV